MSASHSVQLLETEPLPLLVFGCGTVCQQTLLLCDTLSQFRPELKTFLFSSLSPLFCFSFILCGPCGF